MTKDFYDFNPLYQIAEKEKSPAIFIVGGKGNGKTFSIIEKYLEEYLKTGKILRYVRRYKESITPKALQSLLLPQKKNITIFSNGRYNSYMYYRNRFYLTKEDNDGNRIKKDNNPFMVCNALNSVEGYTGADEGSCSAIFFDEFISREKQLQDEFYSLMILHNNCIRNRTDIYTPLILVGNTMTRDSSIARDFGIDLYSLHKGDIQIVKNVKKETTAVVEYCTDTPCMKKAGEKIYSKIDNKKVSMIYTGDWSIGNYPRIESKYLTNSDTNAKLLLIAPKKLLLTIYTYKHYSYGYVKFFNKNDDYDLILTPRITPLQENVLNFFPSNVKVFNVIRKFINTNNVYFECGECGELFKDFLSNFKGAEILSRSYT